MWRTSPTADGPAARHCEALKGPKQSPRRGVTLVELLIALVLFGALMSAAALSFQPVLLAWSSQHDRMELQRQAVHGLERAVRDLRQATSLQNDSNDAIRFTLRESGVSNSYVLYLYNAADTWPPAFNQSTYQLRKASLTGGIGGSFTYGDGTLLMRDVQPPTTSDLSVSGSLATLDLTVARFDETFRLVDRVKRRNP